MVTVGLIGPIGSGKSEVARLFKSWGAAIVSGDDIGHCVVRESKELQTKLVRCFGKDILRNGAVDRSRLASVAFADRQATLKLNRLVHPPLIRELNRQARRARSHRGTVAVVIDAALLLEWGEGKISWDYLVGVWAPRRLRLPRLIRRGLRPADIHQRSRHQMPWAHKKRACDCVVKNDRDRAVLKVRARRCWEKILSLSDN